MQTFKEYYICEGKFSNILATGAAIASSFGAPQTSDAAYSKDSTEVTQNIQSSKPLSLDSEFISHIKSVENSIMKGWNKRTRKWFPHDSFEGGTDTIAYGHKLTRDDIRSKRFENGITMDQANQLLLHDIKKHEDRVKRYMMTKYDVDYNNLTLPQKFLLTDYEYTGVLSKFPSFTIALLVGNKAGMIDEHRRLSKGRPLVDRNNRTVDYINRNF